MKFYDLGITETGLDVTLRCPSRNEPRPLLLQRDIVQQPSSNNGDMPNFRVESVSFPPEKNIYYHPFPFFTSLWVIMLCMRPKGGDIINLGEKYRNNKKGKEID